MDVGGEKTSPPGADKARGGLILRVWRAIKADKQSIGPGILRPSLLPMK